MKFGSLITIIYITLFSTKVTGNEIQSLETLREKASNYALSQAFQHQDSANIEVQTGQLDPRLRLTHCEGELIAFTPPGSRAYGNTTVGVRCDAPKPWSLYIPVKISVYEQVVVVKRALRRGELITAQDITLTKVDTTLARGEPFYDVAPILGSKAKTTLSSGTVLGSDSICVICKGDSIAITANTHSIRVEMAGIALTDGTMGQQIRVQNNASKRILDAVVISSDTVKVGI